MSVDALGGKSTFSYDFLGDQVTTSLPDPSSGAAGGPTTTDTFDLDSEKVQSVDPLSFVSTWSMDSFGNQIAQSLPDQSTGAAGGPTTTWTFTAAHDMLTQTDPDGNVTAWSYNFDAQTTSETIAAGTEYYTRDADGNLTELDDFDARKTTYTFNTLNQETGEKWYTTTTSATPYNSLAYVYDVRGDMLSGSESYASGDGTNSSVALTYSGPGNVTGESQNMDGRYSVVLSNGWNADGTRASLAVSINGSPDLLNTYGYDKLANMTSIAQTSQGDLTNVTSKYVAMGYDNGGDLTSVDSYLAGSAEDAGSGTQVMHEAIAYNHTLQVTDLGYQANSATGTLLAGYHYVYDADRQVSDLYSYSDTAASGGGSASDFTTWAHAAYQYDPDQEVANPGGAGAFSGGTAVTYTNWANAPSTDSGSFHDANGNRNDSGQTTSAGNRVTFDGTYYYQFDTEGNRTARYKSTTGVIDDTATDITTYAWDNRNRMTGLTHQAFYEATPDLEISYSYDIFNRLTEESGDGIDDRYIWDGGNVLEILNSSDNPTERFLDGPAVDQVLAVEEVGGDNPGVNWLLADAQGTVRDVARGVVGGGSVSVSVVDHLIYDAYGRQDTPQSATIQQYQTPIGFRGMLKDALADTSVTTHVSGGGGSGGGGGATTLGPFVPAASLYYSANGGWYDAVTETNVSGAAGNESGAVNAYMFMGNDPTTTGLPMRSAAMVSDSGVGLMGGGPTGGGYTVITYSIAIVAYSPVYGPFVPNRQPPKRIQYSVDQMPNGDPIPYLGLPDLNSIPQLPEDGWHAPPQLIPPKRPPYWYFFVPPPPVKWHAPDPMPPLPADDGGWHHVS